MSHLQDFAEVPQVLSSESSLPNLSITLWPGLKSLHFHDCITLEENVSNPISIPRRLAHQESESSSSLEGQTDHSKIDFVSRTNNQSGEVRIDPSQNFVFIGMKVITQENRVPVGVPLEKI